MARPKMKVKNRNGDGRGMHSKIKGKKKCPKCGQFFFLKDLAEHILSHDIYEGGRTELTPTVDKLSQLASDNKEERISRAENKSRVFRDVAYDLATLIGVLLNLERQF